MGKNKKKRKHQQGPSKFEDVQRANQSLRSATTHLPSEESLSRDHSQIPSREPVRDLNSSSRPQETVPYSHTPRESEQLKAAVAEVWNVGDVILDLYEVKGLLGEGGMGKVYRVHHKNWNIDLAVKTPRPEIISRAGVKENFIREAETWVKPGLHPHTVSFFYVRDLGRGLVYENYSG